MRPTKRDELVQKALLVFYQNGFHATGMDMLATETGVSKTSMYKHFRTKEDLILAVLRLRDEKFRNWLIRRMEELGDTPQEQLIAMFDALGEWFAEADFRGCMFINASAEFAGSDDPIHMVSSEHKMLVLKYLRELTLAADISGHETLADELMLLAEGAIVMAYVTGDKTAAARAKNAAEKLIQKTFDPK